MPKRNAAMFTSKSAEHNTPPDIIEAIRAVFGGEIDFDPASNEDAQQYIKARHYWTAQHEAAAKSMGAPLNVPMLARPWNCRSLWLNPPFTIPSGRFKPDGTEIRERVIDRWVAKWLDAVQEREAEQAALLVPARTDTEWFQPLWGLPMCFISGRLKFGDAETGAPFPCVIVYAGAGRSAFYERFAPFGAVGKLLQN